MRLALVFLAFAGCGGDEKPPPRQANVTTEEAPTADKTPEAPKGPTGARGLAAAQKHAEAIPEIEKELAATPTDDGLFTLLRLEAIAAGKAAEVLDRLDANTAIGDRVKEHFRLRAELALAANRPSDALEAARKIGQNDPEEGAYYTVRAVRAGAPAPAADPSNAFLQAALLDPKKAAPALAGLQLTGWRARGLRAEILQQAGDNAAATAELDAVLASADAEGLIALAPFFAELSADQALAGRHLAAAAKAADGLHAGADATRLTTLAVDRLLRGGQLDAAIELATAILASRTTAQDQGGIAEINLRLAQAHMAGGSVAKALDEASAASKAAQEAALTALAAESAWTQAVAATLLGEAESLADAATRADAARAPVLNAVRAALVADPKGDLSALAAFEAADSMGLRLHLAVARMGVPNAKDHISRAVRLADSLGDTAARIEARLELERVSREGGESSDAVLKELAAIADGLGAAGAPLRAELGARRALTGQAAMGCVANELGDAIKLWTPLCEQHDLLKLREAGLVKDDPNALPDHPLSRVAVGRAYLRAKQLDSAYIALHAGLSALPTHYQGPWAPASVLYGGGGVGLEQDLAALNGAESQIAGALALTLQEWLRSAASMREAFAVGDDPSLALSAADRRALHDAHLKMRSDTIAWLSGGGTAPDAAAAALDEANKKAMANAGFSRGLPAPLADYRKITTELQGTAILSYRVGAGSGEAVVIRSDRGRVVAIKDLKAVRTAADSLSKALRNGAAMGGSPVSPKPGDTLRKALLDVFNKELQGVGRYVVVTDGALRDFSFNVLPEQQEGLRFLADIRSISNASNIAELYRPGRKTPPQLTPDYLAMAIGATSAASGDDIQLASEVENVGRLFTAERRVMLIGKDAKAASFKEKAANARFIHLMDLGASERGAIAIGEEKLQLAEIRGMDLGGKIAILSGKADTAVRARWVQALAAAGVENVLVTAWQIDPGVQASYLHRFFDAVIQERTAARAMSDARQSMQTDESADGASSRFDPSWWGLFILHGMP